MREGEKWNGDSSLCPLKVLVVRLSMVIIRRISNGSGMTQYTISSSERPDTMQTINSDEKELLRLGIFSSLSIPACFHFF